jgi:hypothetical protein
MRMALKVERQPVSLSASAVQEHRKDEGRTFPKAEQKAVHSQVSKQTSEPGRVDEGLTLNIHRPESRPEPNSPQARMTRLMAVSTLGKLRTSTRSFLACSSNGSAAWYGWRSAGPDDEVDACEPAGIG